MISRSCSFCRYRYRHWNMAITRSKRLLETEASPSKRHRPTTASTTTTTATVIEENDIPSLEPPSTPVKRRIQPPPPPSLPVANPVDRSHLLPEFAKGLDHVLAVDSSLQQIVDVATFKSFELEQIEKDKQVSTFEYLVRSIIGQQVSGAAANSIYKKFLSQFELASDQVFPTPKQVIAKTLETLRSAGLSARKAEYITGIAKAYDDGTLSDEKLKSADDDDVTDMLVSLKGIGPWTADMFLLFSQRRMDTFSIGDLGVQRGVSKYIKERPWIQSELKCVDWSIPMEGVHSPGKSAKAQQRKPAKVAKTNGNGNNKWKVPEVNEMLYIANKFRPYRSVFQMIMWRLSDTDLTVIADAQKR